MAAVLALGQNLSPSPPPAKRAATRVFATARLGHPDTILKFQKAGDNEVVGVTHRFTHKCIKVAHYMESCLAHDTPAATTHRMRQLASGPEWVRCTLPTNNTAAGLSTYLARVLSAKKRAANRLATEHRKCYSSSADGMLASASLMSPKDLSHFWRKLRMLDPIKPTKKATVIIMAVPHPHLPQHPGHHQCLSGLLGQAIRRHASLSGEYTVV